MSKLIRLSVYSLSIFKRISNVVNNISCVTSKVGPFYGIIFIVSHGQKAVEPGHVRTRMGAVFVLAKQLFHKCFGTQPPVPIVPSQGKQAVGIAAGER